MTEIKTEANNGTLLSYVVGYLLSLELTMTAYLFVSRHVNSHHAAYAHRTLIELICGLAVAQLLVQLVFFLHLSRGSNKRWNITALLFAAVVLFILVFGSLWIMNNLNYHHPSPDQVNQYLRSQSDL